MSLDFLIFKDRKHQLQRCESLSSPPIRILNKNGIKNCTFFVDWIFQKLNYSLTGLWLKQAPHAKRMHMSGNYTYTPSPPVTRILVPEKHSVMRKPC